MSESGDYSPAPQWSGYDFASARNAYRDVVDRSYSDAVANDIKPSDLIPENISTDCESPLVIVCDVTGSMGDWPATIFSKLPYLEHELGEYLGDNVEVSFAAIGDATIDKYPLQIQPFVKGVDLKMSLEKLVHEKGGGSNSVESYDLAGSYYAKNCEMPNAIRKPIMIFIGDEGLYNYVDQAWSKQWARVEYKDRTTLAELFADLKRKFNVYVVRKPYCCYDNDRSSADIAIEKQWIELISGDHVVNLPDAKRVVDVIFGILAKETGKADYFVDELTDRQMKDTDGKKKIDVVMKSLHTILAVTPDPSKKKLDSPGKANSVSVKDPGAQKSKSLLD